MGNLPARTDAVIKITYVAEVNVQGELIIFDLPASVAPWEKNVALNQKTQVCREGEKGRESVREVIS